MSIRRLRARIEKLEAAYFRQSRMADLISKLKTRDLTEEEEKEAQSLDPAWPATKASINAEWFLCSEELWEAVVVPVERERAEKRARAEEERVLPRRNGDCGQQPDLAERSQNHQRFQCPAGDPSDQ